MPILLNNTEEFKRIEDAVNEVADRVSQLSSRPEHVIYNNKQFCELMGISDKTAQTWRDTRIIKFSQIGRSIFYKLSDVLDMLKRHSVDPIS